MKKLQIRQVKKNDLEGCFEVENLSYTTDGASKEKVEKRINVFPEGFLVAELEGKIVGIVNGTSTNKEDLSDEELKEMAGFDKKGKNLIIFSLAVLPSFRCQGIAKQLMDKFIETAKRLKKEKILLICKDDLIHYYEKIGFIYLTKSKSTHGGFSWHEMYLPLAP
jgi:ribosomal protein S18 acetylase RimI-like enzyme